METNDRNRMHHVKPRIGHDKCYKLGIRRAQCPPLRFVNPVVSLATYYPVSPIAALLLWSSASWLLGFLVTLSLAGSHSLSSLCSLRFSCLADNRIPISIIGSSHPVVSPVWVQTSNTTSECPSPLAPVHSFRRSVCSLPSLHGLTVVFFLSVCVPDWVYWVYWVDLVISPVASLGPVSLPISSL